MSTRKRALEFFSRGRPTLRLFAPARVFLRNLPHAYDLSRGLWPVEHDPKGTGPSLEELARRFGESTGIVVDFAQHLLCATCVNPHLVQLYRIAQEAVTNAVKHAKPNRIRIRLRCGKERTLTLSVRDDGVGRTGMGYGIASKLSQTAVTSHNK